ncbi:insulinase family protein [Eionea flava]
MRISTFRLNFISFYFFLLVSAISVDAYSSVTIEKSQVDDRQYHYLELDNQLRVLLISDPEADKAAASLDVHVGSADDPADREGLAHFLEHMLFLGTQKYPDAADYQAFIDNNAGSHNAYTSAQHTNYFFDIDAQQLEPALDRFAQFFIAPLFDAVYVDRERNAVHSEYQAKIKDDFRRGYDVYRQQINPKHPYAKFSVGSLETLANRPDDNVRDDLIEFYNRHYSSSQMALVVLGKESIADLQRMVVDRFQQIPLREVDTSERIVPLFDSARLPFEVMIEPVQETRHMTMVFPIPSVKAYYREKPLSYIGSLLGHEGEGSVLSILKAQGWAEGLGAGGGEAGGGNATFSIRINLTEAGVKHRDDIRALIFYALRKIEQEGINAWRYKEEQQLAEIAFQYREKGRAINTVSQLADSMHEYPIERIMSAPYRYSRFDEALIREQLSLMTPDNVFVSTVFPGITAEKVTEKYQAPYATRTLSADLVVLADDITARYQLPKPNLFVPSNIALFADGVASEHAVPKKVSLAGKSALWLQHDASFGVPKAHVFARLQSPLAASSVRNAAMNQLLIDIINDQLNENSYPASLAGLSYSLSPNSRGFDLSLRGYNDKMPLLLRMISAQLQKPQIPQDRFDQLKAELQRALSNSKKQTPYKQLFGQLPVSVFSPYYADAEISQALTSITREDLHRFAASWLNGAEINALAYGNLNAPAVDVFKRTLIEWLLAGEMPLPEATVLAIPSLSASASSVVPTVSVGVDHGDTAVGLYVQGATDSLDDQAKMVLLRQVLESDFYSSLRTEQQLGYIVFLTSMTIKEVPGSFFVVQSPSTAKADIQQAINRFLQESIALIPDDLSGFKRSVRTKLLETPQTLSAKAGQYWQDILRGQSGFDYFSVLADRINDINPQQLRAYYQQVMLNSKQHLWFVADRSSEDSDITTQPSQRYYRYP